MSYHQRIYNQLRKIGLTEAGALGLLGNWECESNCEPNRVQGDFQASRAFSKDYTAQVDQGLMSIDEFAGDQKGYGLAQWTYPTRKRNLFQFAKNEAGRSIGDCEMQVDFAWWELRKEYPELLKMLKTATAIHDCVEKVCTQYERPAVNNIQARYEAALRIRQELTEPEEEEDTGYTPPNWATMPAWYPGTLKEGAKGAEVRLLQDILTCRDYYCTPDGIFGKDTRKKLTAFQTDAGLNPTGICGEETWDALKW